MSLPCPPPSARGRWRPDDSSPLHTLVADKVLAEIVASVATFLEFLHHGERVVRHHAKGGQAAITAIDSGVQDVDPAAGVIQVKGLTGGTYTVCKTAAPTDFALPASNCTSASVPNNGSVSLTFVNLTMVRVQFGLRDNALSYVGGATFGLYDDDGVFVGQFADNSAMDLDPTWEKFELEFAAEGTWLLCHGTPPAG